MKELTYEQRLTAIFETERKEKKAADRKLETAKAAVRCMEDRVQAERLMKEAERAHAADVSAAETKAGSAYTKLRAALVEQVQKCALANPDDVEPKAITLLESGILRADDLAALTERYGKNPTI